MIDQQTYSASIASLSGQSRTAGIVPGFAGTSRTAKNAQTTETEHFSKLVNQSMTASPAAGACGDVARTAGAMPVACDDTATETTTADGTSDAANTADQSEQAGQGHGGFLDFILGILDVINPLQHIPVISTLYRHLTGDEISPMAQVAGDTLYGGPIGGALSIANVATKAETGHDIGDHMLAMVTGEKLQNKVHTGREAPQVMLAQNEAPKQKPQIHESDIVWNRGTPVPQMTQLADSRDPGAIVPHANIAASTQTDNIPELSDSQLAQLMSRHAAPAAAKAVAKKTPLLAQQENSQTAQTAQPHTLPRGSTGRGLASYSSSYHAAPVPTVKSGVSTASVLTAAQETGAGNEIASAASRTSTPAFQSQDAPAADARTAVPPGLIASRMMEALDKYSAMNRMGAGLPGYERGLAAAN